MLADLGTFRHVQKFFRHIQAYSELCLTQGYPEPWYILNEKPRHIQNTVKYLRWSVLLKLLTGAVVFENYFRSF